MAESSGVRLFVGGLDTAVDKTHLADLFIQHGITPLTAQVARNAQSGSLGFGFVKVAVDDAERAIELLNRQSFRGQKLKVTRAGPKRNHGRNWFSRKRGLQR